MHREPRMNGITTPGVLLKARTMRRGGWRAIIRTAASSTVWTGICAGRPAVRVTDIQRRAATGGDAQGPVTAYRDEAGADDHLER